MAARNRSKRTEYLELLGINDDASEDDIKLAYRKLALQLHPDKNLDDDGATEKFQKLSEAYQYLMKGEVSDDEDGFDFTSCFDNDDDDDDFFRFRDLLNLLRTRIIRTPFGIYVVRDDDDCDCFDCTFRRFMHEGNFNRHRGTRPGASSNLFSNFEKPPSFYDESNQVEEKRRKKAEKRRQKKQNKRNADQNQNSRDDINYTDDIGVPRSGNDEKAKHTPSFYTTQKQKEDEREKENATPPRYSSKQTDSSKGTTSTSGKQQPQAAPAGKKPLTKKQRLAEQRKKEKEAAEITEQLKRDQEEKQRKEDERKEKERRKEEELRSMKKNVYIPVVSSSKLTETEARSRINQEKEKDAEDSESDSSPSNHGNTVKDTPSVEPASAKVRQPKVKAAPTLSAPKVNNTNASRINKDIELGTGSRFATLADLEGLENISQKTNKKPKKKAQPNHQPMQTKVQAMQYQNTQHRQPSNIPPRLQKTQAHYSNVYQPQSESLRPSNIPSNTDQHTYNAYTVQEDTTRHATENMWASRPQSYRSYEPTNENEEEEMIRLAMELSLQQEQEKKLQEKKLQEEKLLMKKQQELRQAEQKLQEKQKNRPGFAQHSLPPQIHPFSDSPSYDKPHSDDKPHTSYAAFKENNALIDDSSTEKNQLKDVFKQNYQSPFQSSKLSSLGPHITDNAPLNTVYSTGCQNIEDINSDSDESCDLDDLDSASDDGNTADLYAKPSIIPTVIPPIIPTNIPKASGNSGSDNIRNFFRDGIQMTDTNQGDSDRGIGEQLLSGPGFLGNQIGEHKSSSKEINENACEPMPSSHKQMPLFTGDADSPSHNPADSPVQNPKGPDDPVQISIRPNAPVPNFGHTEPRLQSKVPVHQMTNIINQSRNQQPQNFGYSRPKSPLQNVGYQRPNSPLQNVGYQRPKSPLQNVGYQRPNSPLQNVGYQRPNSPLQNIVYQRPNSPLQNIGYQRPNSPLQNVGYKRPNSPHQNMGYQQHSSTQNMGQLPANPPYDMGYQQSQFGHKLGRQHDTGNQQNMGNQHNMGSFRNMESSHGQGTLWQQYMGNRQYAPFKQSSFPNQNMRYQQPYWQKGQQANWGSQNNTSNMQYGPSPNPTGRNYKMPPPGFL
ncbi:unnamed protein product [Owenia fusiformis]|uniref:J domain-containing protein n=1 Tax=Owenia fusiformis TaxID=6347 RepID=A0A8S4N1W2_OWEFU|nr:unnamed protein product [Owenia fusiformis]